MSGSQVQVIGANWTAENLLQLLEAAGINTDGYSAQFSAADARIEQVRADMQRQIDELRGGGAVPQSATPAAAPMAASQALDLQGARDRLARLRAENNPAHAREIQQLQAQIAQLRVRR